jgi:hypothetical protein
MSTKTPLKRGTDPNSGCSFELYDDWLDECAGADVVHLRLDGVPFQTLAAPGRLGVTLNIPRPLAIQLGLITATGELPTTESPEETSGASAGAAALPDAGA